MWLYGDFSNLLDAGQAPAQVSETLRASGVTNRDLDVVALRRYLGDQDLLSLDIATGQWIGPIADVWRDDGAPADLRDGLSELLKHLRNGFTDPIRTTSAERAQQVYQVLGALLARGTITTEQRADIYAIAGGEKFGGLQTEHVEAAIAAKAREELYHVANAAINESVWPVLDDGPAAVAAALRSVADLVDAVVEGE